MSCKKKRQRVYSNRVTFYDWVKYVTVKNDVIFYFSVEDKCVYCQPVRSYNISPTLAGY